MRSREIIYLDENLERIGIVSKELYVYAKLTKTLNEASTLDLELITTASTKKTVDKTKFLIVFDGSEYRFFRAVNISIGNTYSITGSDVGFDDYTSNPVVTSVNLGTPDSVILKTKPSDYTINKIGEFDPQFLNESMMGYGGYKYSEVGTSLDNLRNVIGSYETITFDFSVKFNGNVITKYLNLYSNYAMDTDEVKYRYTYGVNANDIIKEENSSDTFTAAVGLGFNTNEEFLEEDYDYIKDNEDIPLTFENVEWKVSKGDPVDKPFGQNYVEVPSSTKLVSLLYGKPRKKIIRYTDTTEAGAVLRKTYDELVLNTRPKVQFRIASDLFFDTGTNLKEGSYVTIGDYVAIIRNDINIKYRTRIFKLTQDLLISKYIDLEFGDVLFENRAKQMKAYKKETANVDKKVDKNIARIKQLQDTIKSLNDRINKLESWTGIPKEEEEVIEHSPATYFTYSEYTGGYAISGLSTLGQQAVDSGLVTQITTPEVYDDLPVKAVILPYGNHINIPNFVFRVTKNIETFNISPGYLTAKHLRLDEGVKTIGALAGLNTKSKSLRIPDSVTSFASDYTYYNANIERLSVPYFYNEIPNSGTRSYVEYVHLRDPEKEKSFNDFTYLEIEKDGSTIAVINGYTENGVSKKDIVVPEKIGSYNVELNVNCFRNYNASETITFEGDLYKAPAYAFHRNTGLKTIIFKSLEVIDSYAFSYCTSLINLDFGTVILNSISAYAFQYVGLTSFIMPNSVQSIGDYAFYKANIKNLKLSNQLTYISAHSFDSALIEGILDIPKSVVNIYEYAFVNTKLTGISLTPDSMLANIERQVFTGTQIYAVTLPSFTFTNRNAFNSGTVITRF